MQGIGLDICPGDFAENPTTQGLELASIPMGTRILIAKDVLLEITQFGKRVPW